ncbi:MAG: hypothetical protein JXA42_22735 [Anaerolineales bacterium]|nr:hypothetical protein [Anaerolineales bacterium]
MKKHSVMKIWGGLLVAIGLMLLLGNFGLYNSVGRLLWALILGGISAPFLLVFVSDKNQWWSLIPGCTLAGIALSLFTHGALSAIIINGSIAVAFFFIYLSDRDNWWALIPGWVMTCVSLIIFMGWIGLEWLIAPFVMFAIAVPFLVVYLVDREQWWSLIPGGIMTGIGVLILMGEIFSTKTLGPALLILAGIWLIYRSFRPKRASSSEVYSQFSEPGQPEPYDEPEDLR